MNVRNKLDSNLERRPVVHLNYSDPARVVKS